MTRLISALEGRLFPLFQHTSTSWLIVYLPSFSPASSRLLQLKAFEVRPREPRVRAVLGPRDGDPLLSDGGHLRLVAGHTLVEDITAPQLARFFQRHGHDPTTRRAGRRPATAA